MNPLQTGVPVPHGPIIVTGSSGAIGSSTVRRLRREGWTCIGASRSTGPTTDLAWDACDPDGGRKLAAALDSQGFTSLHGLVWAAGTIGSVQASRETPSDVMQRLYHEHVVGFLEAVKHLAPYLDRDPDPSVIAFSGGGGTAPLPRYMPYAAAKAALVRVVETLSEEEPGWTVNAIAPGFVASRMHDVTLAAGPERAGAYHSETIERLRDPTSPDVAAGLVAFLISGESRGITGRLISAPWDPWEDAAWQARLAVHPTLGRTRRVDDQWVIDQRFD